MRGGGRGGFRRDGWPYPRAWAGYPSHDDYLEGGCGSAPGGRAACLTGARKKKERLFVAPDLPWSGRPVFAGADGAAQPRRGQFVEGRRSQGVLFGGVGVLVFAQSLASDGVRGVAAGRTRGRGAFTLFAPRISHSVHGAMIRVVSGVILPECLGAPLGPGPPCLDEVAEAGVGCGHPPSAALQSLRLRAPVLLLGARASRVQHASFPGGAAGSPARLHRCTLPASRPATGWGLRASMCDHCVQGGCAPVARGRAARFLFCGPRCCPLCHPQRGVCGVRDGAGQLPGACSRPAACLRLGRQPLGKDAST